MKSSKILVKNDIYLFNSREYDDELAAKLHKLFEKIKQADLDVKLIKNLAVLEQLNKKKCIEKQIAQSCVFLSVVKKFTFNIPSFQRQIRFAYESTVKIVLILLEEIQVDELDEPLRNVFEYADTYSFYKDQKAADNIIPIKFNSFLSDLNYNISIQVCLNEFLR